MSAAHAMWFDPRKEQWTRIDNAAEAISDLSSRSLRLWKAKTVDVWRIPGLTIRGFVSEPAEFHGKTIAATLIGEDGPYTPPAFERHLLLGGVVIYATGMTAEGRTALPLERLKGAVWGVTVQTKTGVFADFEAIGADPLRERLLDRAIRRHVKVAS